MSSNVVSTYPRRRPRVLPPCRTRRSFALCSLDGRKPASQSAKVNSQNQSKKQIQFVKIIIENTWIRLGITWSRKGSITCRPWCSTTFWSILIAPIFRGYSSVVIIDDVKLIILSAGKIVAIVAAHFSAIRRIYKTKKQTFSLKSQTSSRKLKKKKNQTKFSTKMYNYLQLFTNFNLSFKLS